MTKYPPLTIKGYRQLTDDEIGLINSIKLHGESLEGQISHLYECAGKSDPSIDIRWLEIGRAQLQQGIMALCRAVARPEGF